jgi:polar amino acid transport system permease protein
MPAIFDLIDFSEQGWGSALLKGLWMTLQISAGAFVVGLFIGLVVACAKLSAPRPVATLMRGYTTLFRAVPELLLILLLYYVGSMGLNALMLWAGYSEVDVSGPLVAILVLGLVQGAYASEIFRAAILAIPHGQIEAARAFGLNGFGLFRRVTLPIMAPYALAGMANLWINLIKDSALISVVGTNELLYTAKQAAGSTRHYLLFYLTAAALYYLVTLTSNYLSGRIERRIRRWMPLAE